MERHLVESCKLMPHNCRVCGGGCNRNLSGGHNCETLLFEKMMLQRNLTREQTQLLIKSVKRREETINYLEKLLKQQASDFAK